MHIVAINAASADTNQADLTAVCAFPLLQDTADADAWGQLGGAKDDFFVFDAAGAQVAHLPASGDAVTDLSNPDGYNNVKAALLAAD